MGHSREASSRAEDATICRGAHTSRVCHGNGGNSERAQFDHEQYGRNRVQLAGRYARATAGEKADERVVTDVVILNKKSGDIGVGACRA
jgi:hypothetical protein